jgi:hypothetical protein
LTITDAVSVVLTDLTITDAVSVVLILQANITCTRNCGSVIPT